MNAAAALRRLYRLPLLTLLVAAGLAIVLVVFPWAPLRVRRPIIERWSRLLLAFSGVLLVPRTAAGARPLHDLEPGRMLVGNHVSWLDIFAVDALAASSFVAKAEIARWPLLGTLVARCDTLFIERGKRHAVHRMIERVAARLREGGRVAIFAEGTTSDGRRLLPFHANLMQAALEANAPVVPFGVRYLDAGGDHASAVEFTGDTTFVASLWRVTGATGVRCELHVLPEIPPDHAGTRHALAERVRMELSRCLALPLEDTRPGTLPGPRAARP